MPLQSQKSKTTKASSAPGTAKPTAAVQQSRQKATQKAKINPVRPGKTPEKVLGDVDYVGLLLGGRRKAREEADKMA